MDIPNEIKNDPFCKELYTKTYKNLEDIGLLTNLDDSLLERFVITSRDIKRMENTIHNETNGTGMVVSQKTSLSEIHPLTRPLNEKMRLLQPMIESLGLSPKSRRLLVRKQDDNDDADDSEALFGFLNVNNN
mgnify:CR=1 FL=1